MKLNDKSIPTGSYTLYAIPAENKMTIIINSATHVWGVYSYKKENDITRITVPLVEVDELLEVFSMAFLMIDFSIFLWLACPFSYLF